MTVDTCLCSCVSPARGPDIDYPAPPPGVGRTPQQFVHAAALPETARACHCRLRARQTPATCVVASSSGSRTHPPGSDGTSHRKGAFQSFISRKAAATYRKKPATSIGTTRFQRSRLVLKGSTGTTLITQFASDVRNAMHICSVLQKIVVMSRTHPNPASEK
jgi:hypothetical protein